MSVKKQRIKKFLGVAMLLIAVILPTNVFAALSNSTNYQINEVFFGSGGELDACSVSFCSKQSAGELAVGRTASTNYQAQGGFNTDRTPYIEVAVGTASVDMGDATATTTRFGTANFSVKAYLAHGYTVVTASDPPQNNTYTIQTSAVPSASSAGTEQFGINLVSNTSPVNFGADPVQDPNNTFGFGVVTADYSTPNLYKYTKGNVIAQSASSSSFTDYTISYIVNVSNVTPGGVYTMNHVLVATGTF